MTIILRSRQYTMVNRSLKALEIYGNTLSIAPTGAGKTIPIQLEDTCLRV